jgi:hypothetical protein
MPAQIGTQEEVWTATQSRDDTKYTEIEDEDKIAVFKSAYDHFRVATNIGKPYPSLHTGYAYKHIFPIYIHYQEPTPKSAKFAYISEEGYYGFVQLKKTPTPDEVEAAMNPPRRGGRFFITDS